MNNNFEQTVCQPIILLSRYIVQYYCDSSNLFYYIIGISTVVG